MLIIACYVLSFKQPYSGRGKKRGSFGPERWNLPCLRVQQCDQVGLSSNFKKSLVGKVVFAFPVSLCVVENLFQVGDAAGNGDR